MSLKKCPYCAEKIQAEAIICKHCKMELKSEPNISGGPVKTQNSATTVPIPIVAAEDWRKDIKKPLINRIYPVLMIIFVIIVWNVLSPKNVSKIKSKLGFGDTAKAVLTVKPNQENMQQSFPKQKKEVLNSTTQQETSKKSPPKYRLYSYEETEYIVPQDFLGSPLDQFEGSFKDKSDKAIITLLTTSYLETKTIEQVAAELTETYKANPWDRVYKKVYESIHSNFFIMAFQSDEDIVYKKTCIKQYESKTDVFEFSFSYSLSDKNKYEPMVTDILKGFKVKE